MECPFPFSLTLILPQYEKFNVKRNHFIKEGRDVDPLLQFRDHGTLLVGSRSQPQKGLKRVGKKCPGGSFLCWVGFGRNQHFRDAQLQSPLESAEGWGGGELVPGAPADIKILGCSSPLYKRAKYNEYSLPYLSSDFAFEDSTSRRSIGHIRQCLGRICGCETRGLGQLTVFSWKKKPFLTAGHLGLLKS